MGLWLTEACLWPESEGVADEAEQVSQVFGPAPWCRVAMSLLA